MAGAGLLVAMATSNSHAADSVRERLATFDVLRGEFVQEKRVSGFDHPLRSAGSLLLVRGRGLVWETRAPFPSALVLSAGRLTLERDGDIQLLADSTRSGGGAEQLQQLLPALVSGDLPTLETLFVVHESLQPDGTWTAQLTPRDAAWATVITRIELTGDRFVRQVVIDEPGGDHSEVRFESLRNTPTELSDTERAHFE
jgi:hypothetical protein